jgi:hypothetical protein
MTKTSTKNTAPSTKRFGKELKLIDRDALASVNGGRGLGGSSGGYGSSGRGGYGSSSSGHSWGGGYSGWGGGW